MGIRRYLTFSNWYSDRVEILFKKMPGTIKKYNLKKGHEIKEITFDNITDSRRFEDNNYADIYKKMLEHGDYGIFGYVDGICAFRCWGQKYKDGFFLYGKKIVLEDRSIYVHYVKTAADYRRKGLAKEGLSVLIEKFHDRNIYVLIDMTNKASIQLHKKCFGFEEIAVIHTKYRFMHNNTDIYWL